MELKLVSTEYNFEYENYKVKAILGYHDGRASVDLFINDDFAYYYIINDLKTLILDDTELIDIAADRIFEDRERWIRDCSVIKDHMHEFKLVNKGSIYTYTSGDLIFFLKLTTTNKTDGHGYIFRLEYTNNQNKDVLDCYVEANDYAELIGKSFSYAQTITEISTIFTNNQSQLMNNAFSKYFYK